MKRLLANVLMLFLLSSCSRQPFDLVEKRDHGSGFPPVTEVTRFKDVKACQAQLEKTPENANVECVPAGPQYDAMFRKEPAGVWYYGRQQMRFPPIVTVIHFDDAYSEDMRAEMTRYGALHYRDRFQAGGAQGQVWAFAPERQISLETFLPVPLNDILVEPPLAELELVKNSARIRVHFKRPVHCGEIASTLAEFVKIVAKAKPEAGFIDIMIYLPQEGGTEEKYLGMVTENNPKLIRQMTSEYPRLIETKYRRYLKNSFSEACDEDLTV